MALFTPVSRIKELYLDTGSVSHIHSSREETELPEHLVSMFEEGCVGLNNEQRVEFKQFLLRNKMSFEKISWQRLYYYAALLYAFFIALDQQLATIALIVWAVFSLINFNRLSLNKTRYLFLFPSMNARVDSIVFF